MPVVKMYDISSVDEIKKIDAEVSQMQENKKYSQYTEADIMLIRTTENFPAGRVVQPLSEMQILNKSRGNFIYQSMQYELSPDLLEQLEINIPVYRSTVHFTENGLVASHIYGNFDDKGYIIMDPLVEHVWVDDIRCFAGQDTFIKGSVSLSDKAIIIIKTENYERIRETYPEIEEFNVVLYNGIPSDVKQNYIEESDDDILAQYYTNDERGIVERVLMDLGYVPETIGSNYILDSPTSNKIVEINRNLGEKYGVLSNSLHAYSQEHTDDFDSKIMLIGIFDKMLLDFILKTHSLDPEMVTLNGKIHNNTGYNLVRLLGIEEVISCVDTFNNTIENMVNLGAMPNPNEIINNGAPDVFDFYTQTTSLRGTRKSN